MEQLTIRQTDQTVVELCQKDPFMHQLVTIVGDIEVMLRPDYFQSLVRSMIGQQISVAAASAIYNRLQTLMGNKITAKAIKELDDDSLRSVGLSARKVVYLRDLAEKTSSLEVNLNLLPELDNTQVIKQLTSIKGIGKWTAEMFLIFSLTRMNVLALDDIGIQRGAKWLYQVDKSERRKILQKKANLWDPHFTIASFYLWEVVHLEFDKYYGSINEIKTEC
ncbi:DNA-3-methyladenine glycosylase family protein [Lentibacillus sp. Marseille-P4043]|uniref:DNA-3-methyladenine glycosylase family protein n=1 Tax=Lentibacillus sp. Marseille-P4043 TaxID=2040293 RepID=UPI000D0AD31A|nr:DNA-3-methyladenine glycosylase [Lentibacillus sp. Marseille-P4043]